MISRITKTVLIEIIFLSTIFAENGSLSGRVTSDLEGLAGANVFLIGTTLGAVTDSLGNYNIENIPTGKYVIRADYIGYESKEKQIYISKYQNSTDLEKESGSSFSEKLGLDEEEITEDISRGNTLTNINFILKSSVLEIDQIVISASRREEKIIDAVANITAVSGGKIRRTGGGDIGYALKTAKGVDVYQVGLGRTNVNVRGFMSAFNGRFITMIDGMSLNDPIFSTYSTQPIPLTNHDIDRVEVVFGPSSAIYGPNAHNGLMNIITKHPKDIQSNIFTTEIGPNEYNSTSVRFAKNYGDYAGFKFSLLNRYYLDWDPNKVYGSDLNWNTVYEENEIIEVFNTREELEIKELVVDFNSYYKLTKSLELGFGHNYSKNKGYVPYEIAAVIGEPTFGRTYLKLVSPSFFLRYTRFDNKIKNTYPLDLIWTLDVRSPNLSRNEIINDFDKQSYSSVSNRFEFQFNNRFQGFDITTGFDYLNTAPNTKRQLLNDTGPNPPLNIRYPVLVQSDTMDYIENDIEISEYGAYTQISKLLNYDMKLLAALRYDKHSYFDGQISPRVALQWNGLDAGHIRISYNKAFQTPSLYNLHFLYHALAIGTAPVPLDPNGNIIHPSDPANQFALYEWFVRADTNGDGNVSPEEASEVSIFMEGVVMGNKDGFVINDSLQIPGLKVEEVSSYEFAIKKLLFGKLFIDASFFYSKYDNFKSQLQRMNNLFPNTEPFAITQITEANGERRPGNEWILSFITLQNIEVYGLDLYFKYLLNKKGDELTFGYSYYGTGSIEDKKTNSSLEKGNDFFVGNAMLDTEAGHDFDPYADLVFFNAPQHKMFSTYMNNSFLEKGYFEFTINYKSKFDFISAAYTLSDTQTKTSFFHPNPYYANTGAIGGNLIYDFMAGYKITDNFDFNMRLNNLTDAEAVILVGSPPSRRSYILGLEYTF